MSTEDNKNKNNNLILSQDSSLKLIQNERSQVFKLPRQKSRSRDRRESRMFLVDGQLFWSDDTTVGGLAGDKRHSSATSFALGSSMDLSGIGQSLDSSGGAGSGSEEVISYRMKWCRESIAQLKRQTWPMEKKLATLKACKLFIKQHQGELKQSKQAKDVLANTSAFIERYWRHAKRELANFLVIITPWEMRIKKIESHFGSVVASYFTFLRWIFWLNLANSLVLCSFVLVPELIENAPDVTGMRKGELGMVKREGEDPDFNPTLGEIWEFEGFLKFSPIFYGYYSNKEISRWGFWRNPIAYLTSVMLTYLLCFFCISRKLSQNSKLSRAGTKDDEYTFCWTVFVGWDFMIGNSETAYNKTSSLIMNLKEGILEEKEQTKDRDWRLISRRVLANIISIALIVSSAYVVAIAVQRSENLPDDATMLQKNELQLVMSGIQFVFPPLFDAIGFMEGYHPRKGLNWQLGRILSLDFLNFYTLMYALFGSVEKMVRQLNEVAGNMTMLRQNHTYYENLFTTTTTTTTTTTSTTAQPSTTSITPTSTLPSNISLPNGLNILNVANISNEEIGFQASNATSILSVITNTTTTLIVNSSAINETTLASGKTSVTLVADSSQNTTVYITSSTAIPVITTTSEILTTTPTTTIAATTPISASSPNLVKPTTNPDYDYPDIGQFISQSTSKGATINPTKKVKRQFDDYTPTLAPIRDPYRTTKHGDMGVISNQDNSWDEEPLEGRLPPTTVNGRGRPSNEPVARPIGGGRVTTIRPRPAGVTTMGNSEQDDDDTDQLSSSTNDQNIHPSTETSAQGSENSQTSNSASLGVSSEDGTKTTNSFGVSLSGKTRPDQANFTDTRPILAVSLNGTKSIEIQSNTSSNTINTTNSMDHKHHAGINGTKCLSLPNQMLNVSQSNETESCGLIGDFKYQEILGNSTIREKLKSLCWETMFGQEMVKMVVMDLVMTVFSALAFEFMRACFVRYCNRFFFWDLERGLPGYQDFKIAENVLHLVNNQSNVWMGMFFAPGLPAINTIKLAVLMYVRSWAVLTCNIPHETVFKVSKSNNFYYLILLVNLIICIMPVAYAVTWIRPSWHCGPFGGECRMYAVLTKLINSMLPPEVNGVLKYLTSPGTIIPVLILFILIIYYLSSTLSSSKEANKELKAQLKKDKEQEGAVPEITSTAVVETTQPAANEPSGEQTVVSNPMLDRLATQPKGPVWPPPPNQGLSTDIKSSKSLLLPPQNPL